MCENCDRYRERAIVSYMFKVKEEYEKHEHTVNNIAYNRESNVLSIDVVLKGNIQPINISGHMSVEGGIDYE